MGTVAGMKVPLTVLDFIERAELVYGDRIGRGRRARPARRVVGRAHLQRGWPSSLAPRPPASTRSASARASGSRSSSQNSARLLTSFFGVQRVRARPRADQLPAERRRGRLHRRALGRVGAARRSRARRVARGVEREAPLRDRRRGRRRAARASTRSPSRGRPTRTRPRTINYTSGTTARPKGVQLTHRNLWVNATTFGWHTGVNDRDVYLHTLPMFHCNGWGMPYAVTGMGGQHIVLRKVDGARDPAARRRARRDAAVRRARRRRRDPRRRRELGRPDPGRGPRAHGRRRRAAADPHDRAHRDRARLGVHPDLRPHRDVAVAHDEPRPRRVRRPRRRASARAAARPRRCARARRASCASTTKARCSRAATSCSRATGSSPRPPPTAIVDGWFHTGDGGTHRRRGLPHDLRPQEGRDHLRRRERVVDRGRGRAVLASRRRRGRRDRRARREVGRDGEGARGARARARSATEQELIEHCRDRSSPTSSARRRSSSATSSPRTATGKLQKFKLRAPYWEGRDRQVN